MKKLTVVIATVALAFIASDSAFAGKKKGYKSKVRTSQSQARYQSSYPQFGVGVTSGSRWLVNTVTGVSPSVWIALSRNAYIQGLFNISRTNPTFQFSAGGLFKYNIHGSNYAGFHVGGGAIFGNFTSGNNDAFFTSIPLVGGAHFAIPSLRNLMFNIDAGPTFIIADSQFNFAFDAASTVLGISLHYLF